MIKSAPLYVLITENGKIFADMDRDVAYEQAADGDDAHVVRELELVINVPDPVVRAQIDLPQEGGKAEVTIR